MWEGFVGNLIRRTSQRMLIVALVLLAGLTLFFAYKRSYFFGFFAGPHTVTAQQLTAASSPAAFANPFLSVADEGEEPTDLQEIHNEDGRNVLEASFASAVVGAHHMLVRVAPDAANAAEHLPSATVTGEIKKVDDLRGSVYGNYAAPAGDLLPIYLDTYNYRTSGYIALALCIPILLLALWLLWRWFQISSDFSRHPLCRKLSGQGQLEMLVQQIDSEMAAPHTSYRRGGRRAEVSQHWLVASQPMSAVAMQLAGIVWIHRTLVKRRLYFVLTVSKRHLVNVYDQFGQKTAIQLTEASAGQLFEELRRLTPRAIHGFDKRVQSLWRKTPNKTGFPEAAAALLGGEVLPDLRVTSQYSG